MPIGIISLLVVLVAVWIKKINDGIENRFYRFNYMLDDIAM